MDIQLEKLINKIKSEGITAAEKEADKIVKEARKKAAKITEEAEQKAEDTLAEAKKEAQKIEAKGKAALQQAQRDTILTTKEQLTELLDKVFKREVGQTLKPEFMQKMIMQMVAHTAKDESLEFVVSEADKQKLRQLVLSNAKADLQDTVIFKVERGITSGFRVGLKDENVYYDFTDQSIADFMSEFLNPSIRELLAQPENQDQSKK